MGYKGRLARPRKARIGVTSLRIALLLGLSAMAVWALGLLAVPQRSLQLEEEDDVRSSDVALEVSEQSFGIQRSNPASGTDIAQATKDSSAPTAPPANKILVSFVTGAALPNWTVTFRDEDAKSSTYGSVTDLKTDSNGILTLSDDLMATSSRGVAVFVDVPGHVLLTPYLFYARRSKRILISDRLRVAGYVVFHGASQLESKGAMKTVHMGVVNAPERLAFDAKSYMALLGGAGLLRDPTKSGVRARRFGSYAEPISFSLDEHTGAFSATLDVGPGANFAVSAPGWTGASFDLTGLKADELLSLRVVLKKIETSAIQFVGIENLAPENRSFFARRYLLGSFDDGLRASSMAESFRAERSPEIGCNATNRVWHLTLSPKKIVPNDRGLADIELGTNVRFELVGRNPSPSLYPLHKSVRARDDGTYIATIRMASHAPDVLLTWKGRPIQEPYITLLDLRTSLQFNRKVPVAPGGRVLHEYFDDGALFAIYPKGESYPRYFTWKKGMRHIDLDALPTKRPKEAPLPWPKKRLAK